VRKKASHRAISSAIDSSAQSSSIGCKAGADFAISAFDQLLA
jgi:hypothetical protein